MWLIERLPKETSEQSAVALGEAALLARALSREVSHRLQCVWTPSFCKKGGIAWRGGDTPSWHLEGTSSIVGFRATDALTTPASNTSKGAKA